MSHNRLDPKLLTIGELFGDAGVTYTVPIYQRNYAWQVEQIEQLLGDIRDAIRDKKESYFLGNLVVTELQTQTPTFEVIDGQQRLTTLYLLLNFLTGGSGASAYHHNSLRYESRPRATEALRRISTESLHQSGTSQSSTTEDSGIRQAYNVIQQYMAQHVDGDIEWGEFADFLRTKTTIVRASLPGKTDFNRSFEIMNTRGQQLEQADIVKARLMQQLDDAALQACFAWVWEACSDMDSYVQMSLTRGDRDLRCKIFGDDWSRLALPDFHSLVAIHKPPAAIVEDGVISSTSLTLDDAIGKYAGMGTSQDEEDQDNVRFRSPIEFPAFLLHVLKVIDGNNHEEEGLLDDKVLVKRFVSVLECTGVDNSWWVQDFAFRLLRCRNLFDSYVLKRQYTTANSDEGDWSLQRLLKRSSKGKPTPGYRNTFSRGSDEVEEDGDIDGETNDLLMLQSMLRVTYTSPRTMHWITRILKRLDESDLDRLTERDLADCLRDYTRDKVREAFFADEEPVGFSISRIVFTYLDYLLWADGQNPDFTYSFRNSIEHFYPQNPDEQQSGTKVSEGWLHRLGNLALVSVGANSKFSNSMPKAKAENFRTTIEIQSPKLQIMAETTRKRQQWGDEEVREHHIAMVERLSRDIGI